jgi:hypothetical protein
MGLFKRGKALLLSGNLGLWRLFGGMPMSFIACEDLGKLARLLSLDLRYGSFSEAELMAGGYFIGLVIRLEAMRS